MERKPLPPWGPHARHCERPYHVFNGKIGKEERLTLEEFRARPEEHLEPGYQYPYSTYMSYDGENDTLIDRPAWGPAANASTLKSSTSKQGSTSKGKSQDKGKSVAK